MDMAMMLLQSSLYPPQPPRSHNGHTRRTSPNEQTNRNRIRAIRLVVFLWRRLAQLRAFPGLQDGKHYPRYPCAHELRQRGIQVHDAEVLP